MLFTIKIYQECICCYILSRSIRSVFAAIYYQDISGVYLLLYTIKIYQEWIMSCYIKIDQEYKYTY